MITRAASDNAGGLFGLCNEAFLKTLAIKILPKLEKNVSVSYNINTLVCSTLTTSTKLWSTNLTLNYIYFINMKTLLLARQILKKTVLYKEFHLFLS